MTEPNDLELLRGTLDLLILKTLSWGPMHGLAVLRWIEEVTRRRLQIEEGALYPALHRLEQKEWLDAEWGYTDRNRKAKFYRLTTASSAGGTSARKRDTGVTSPRRIAATRTSPNAPVNGRRPVSIS